jgi:hypothetical protein
VSNLKLFLLAVSVVFVSTATASAQPWGRYHYRGPYRPYYPYPPVVVAPPPPVVVAPPYAYPAPAYLPPPAPIYGPPVYGYGVVRPRGYGFGYSSPGFGVYIGR